MEAAGGPRQRLVSVDVLRALAALAVLFAHVPHPAFSPNKWSTYLFYPAEFGGQGVTLFLLLSGFCIHIGTARKALSGAALSCNWIAFWRRRFYRLYPPYLAAIVLSLAACLPWHGPTVYYLSMEQIPGRLYKDLIAHLLMVHNLFPKYIHGLNNGAFWTLGLEEQLYALYALFLLFRRRVSAAGTFAITLTVMLLWWLAGSLACDSVHLPALWAAWPLTFWGIWTLGSLAGEAAVGAITLPRWCYSRRIATGCAILGVFLHSFTVPTFQVLMAQLPVSWQPAEDAWLVRLVDQFWFFFRLTDYVLAVSFFIVLNRWIRAEANGGFQGRVSNVLAHIGRMSYSLYLVHGPVLVLVEQFWPPSMPISSAGSIIRYVVGVPLCLAVSSVFYWLIERWFISDRISPRNYQRISD
jgi:peptidoglycan/LPS O-acetylase OafA/YrhL